MTASKYSTPKWFGLKRYAATAGLNFEGWSSQIGNRIYLHGLLATDQFEKFDEQFANVQTNPFFDLGFKPSFASAKAAYPLTFGVAESMLDVLRPLSPQRATSCDQKLSEVEQNPFVMQGHLTIDLNASKDEILADFKEWLETELRKNRERFPRPREAGITQAVIESWHDHQILPYQDLILWHKRHNTDMPSQSIIVEWLFPGTEFTSDRVRDTRSKAEKAFQLNTLRQLNLAAR
jgi:hypothetical protein